MWLLRQEVIELRGEADRVFQFGEVADVLQRHQPGLRDQRAGGGEIGIAMGGVGAAGQDQRGVRGRSQRTGIVRQEILECRGQAEAAALIEVGDGGCRKRVDADMGTPMGEEPRARKRPALLPCANAAREAKSLQHVQPATVILRCPMRVRTFPVTPTRPCRHCLALQDDSVFADFDADSDGQLYLVRISFDGFGCCEPGWQGRPVTMSPDDSRTLVRYLEAGDHLGPDAARILTAYFAGCGAAIWVDALEEHGLL